jgi:hypothetical protein
MDDRLVTAQDRSAPHLRELATPAAPPAPSPDETRRALLQRQRVAASLLACPDRAGAAPIKRVF